MSDSDEVATGQELCFEEARKLYNLCPDHELLRYFKEANSDAVWEEFMLRFAKPGLTREQMRAYPSMAWIYAGYFLALRAACKAFSPAQTT